MESYNTKIWNRKKGKDSRRLQKKETIKQGIFFNITDIKSVISTEVHCYTTSKATVGTAGKFN